MSIYRGPGGSGDAVNDSSSEATLVAQLVVEAQADADAAAASATAAAGSASTASTQATNAANSATAAASSASSASSSASSATSSASSASTSATNAANSATAAQTAETNAETAETNAETAQAAAEAAQLAAETAQTAAELAETNAETAETNAETAETNAASSASAASTSATNASNSASAASTSATNASNSASAASTSASNAATSESNASTSATTATTQAGIATTQAGLASTSASNAATSETNASNSASAAATSATNASNSASAAATSETNAAASFDSFDDRYLGAKSSAPTLDNDGNTLLVGALYFNSVDSAMKVWNGTAWLDAYASLSGALIATNNLADLTNTTTARSNLGVAIGTNVQAWDADLDTWATKTAPSGTVVGTSDSQTLTTKTIALGSNTVSGTLAEFNTAVTDADLVSIAGTETLTNKTLTTPVISSITNTGTLTLPTSTDTLVGRATTDTLTNKTLTNPTINGFTGDTSVVNLGSGQFYKASGGNIGIGTTNPLTKLSVSDGGAATFEFIPNYVGSGANRIQSFNRSTSAYSSWQYDALNHVFETSATERMRIDASGNVGIGTSSPNQKLDIVGTGATIARIRGGAGTNQGAGFFVANSTATASLIGLTDDSQINGGTPETLMSIFSSRPLLFYASDLERMRITSAGNVGIGNSSPQRILTVGSGGGSTVMSIFGGTGSSSAIHFTDTNTSTDFQGFVTYGHDVDALRFGTAETERMRIDSSGLVGIGTSSPTQALTVTGGAGAGALIYSAGSTGGGSLFLRNTQSSDYTWRLAVGGGDNAFVAGRGLFIRDENVGATRLAIDSSGNVGIGTVSPTNPLDVVSDSGAAAITMRGRASDNISTFRFLSNDAASTYGQIQSRSNGLWINAVASIPIQFFTADTERMRITSTGDLLVGTTSSSGKLTVADSSAQGTRVTQFTVPGTSNIFSTFTVSADSSNGAATAVRIGQNTSTSRSINAGGTINAAGLDYAEYMVKAGNFEIAKGDICGIDANGKLTNVFSDAISFVVKSTNPSYVGGDLWGADLEGDELEFARQTVDRIAFSGQVPVNVTGATAGQYIVPINNNGAIKGQAVSNPTFEQYQLAVGKVIAIESDGRARIIVKVA
jgi:hypothetical protein